MGKTVTKKMLSADAPAGGETDHEFVVPYQIDGEFVLLGISTGRTFRSGRVVYTGSDLTRNDLFAAVVDGGHKIPDVENFVDLLEEFLRIVKSTRIGSDITITTSDIGTIELAAGR